MLVSVWLELAEQYLQSVVLEFSLQLKTYVTTLNIPGIGWKTSVVGWSDSRWVLCTFMLSSDYDAELVLWLLDCLWGVCYFISGYMLHISLRRLIASAEKMAPHQTRNVLVDKCLGFRCWTYQPPLHKFLQDMCWTPAPVLNCTHGGLNFQHKALCMLHSWGNLCSFAEMVSNNKENSKLAMTCVQYFLYVRWRQRDGRDVYRPSRYTGFSAYPQGGFHQHPHSHKFCIKWTCAN